LLRGGGHGITLQNLDNLWTSALDSYTVSKQNLDRKSCDMYKMAESAQKRATGSRSLVLLAAAISFLFSVTLWFAGNELQGTFVGLWVPSILSLGSIVLPRGESS